MTIESEINLNAIISLMKLKKKIYYLTVSFGINCYLFG